MSTSTTAAIDSSQSTDETTTSSSHFDVEEELAKIATSCMSSRNYEQLTGNVVRHAIARSFSGTLISNSVDTIGLAELRAVLNFAPLPPWKHYNRTIPSESKLESAPTLEAYYDLKEPRLFMRSLDSNFLFEHNVSSAVAYLDKRFPSIRTIYRRKFEEIRRSAPGVLDRKIVDRMIVEFHAIYKIVRDATKQMSRRDDECWDGVD